MVNYTCKDCGVHYNQDVAPAGQCPVCGNSRQIDRLKEWIREKASRFDTLEESE